MELPRYVRRCIDALEEAGYAAYAVGGCVRDSLLGLIPHDYDLCTAATPEQIRSVFAQYRLVLAGEKHGTVTVITEQQPVEITTFRLEGGYQDNRHPDWVRFVTDVEEDLSRRDFTVNAMAYSPTRGLSDPFGGREDLKKKCLRTVGDPTVRFTEDALRILRGIRFSVRYGLTVGATTRDAMFALAPLMDSLARERVFDELCKLLPLVNAQDLLNFTPVLKQVIPELAPLLGFAQHTIHHAYDVFTHTAHVVEAVPAQLSLRWAALLHDIAKPATFHLDEKGSGHFPDHAKRSSEIADSILLRLKAPTGLRMQVKELIALHMTPLDSSKKSLRRHLGKYGLAQTRELLALQLADFSSKGTGETTEYFSRAEALLEEILADDACFTVRDLAISGSDLLKLGFVPGPGIGACLEHLLALVQEDTIPNEPAALQQEAQRFLMNR